MYPFLCGCSCAGLCRGAFWDATEGISSSRDRGLEPGGGGSLPFPGTQTRQRSILPIIRRCHQLCGWLCDFISFESCSMRDLFRLTR